MVLPQNRQRHTEDLDYLFFTVLISIFISVFDLNVKGSAKLVRVQCPDCYFFGLFLDPVEIIEWLIHVFVCLFAYFI